MFSMSIRVICSATSSSCAGPVWSKAPRSYDEKTSGRRDTSCTSWCLVTTQKPSPQLPFCSCQNTGALSRIAANCSSGRPSANVSGSIRSMSTGQRGLPSVGAVMRVSWGWKRGGSDRGGREAGQAGDGALVVVAQLRDDLGDRAHLRERADQLADGSAHELLLAGPAD